MKLTNLLELSNIVRNLTPEELFNAAVESPQSNLPLLGQFSFCHEKTDAIYLIRDRLGINKLFYYIDSENRTVTASNFFEVLADRCQDCNRILSVPPGHWVRIDRSNGQTSMQCYYDISSTTADPEFSLSEFHQKVSEQLRLSFLNLRDQFPHAKFIVCLSGGLDSSLIASYAKKYLPNVTAATFSYSLSATEALNVSEDFTSAKAIAQQIGLPFLQVLENRSLEIQELDRVLLDCQDWRDFNVHCAWVNHYLGQAMRRQFPKEEIVFLTGDLMNEYVADYTPVTYKNQIFYPQPKISRPRLRKFFVYGLDTSDREIGVFHRYGIKTFQPYADLAELYLQVPDDWIEKSNCKELLNLPLIPDSKVQELIVKTKVRAQVGGKEGGTLGLFIDQGFTQSFLQERWNSLLMGKSREGNVSPVILSGRYRSSL